MRPITLLLAAAFAAATFACRDTPTAPTAGPDPPNQAAYAVSDGAHGGANLHFFFLPPVVPEPTFAGTFDPTLAPDVEICVRHPAGRCMSGPPIATFSTTRGTGSERVRVDAGDELYIVNWHTSRYAVEPGVVYRIGVKVGTTSLGYLDVSVGHDTKVERRALDADVFTRNGGTLPIKFRIEQGALSPARPLWKFTMLAAISKPTADALGGYDAAVRFVRAQIDTLNSRFNTPKVFAGEFLWSLDSIYEYTGTGLDEVRKPHPGFDYKYIVDGYQGPGGWWGDYDVVFLSWPIEQITTPGATDAIVHEFGHARGAIDTYAIKADGQFNPVNGASYHPGRSIMDYPYGETVWDQHSINLIDRTADVVHAPPSYITEAFPSSIGVLVTDGAGIPQDGARLAVYPVPWFENRVDPNPRFVVTTDARGEYVFPQNPYDPGSRAPWLMLYPNYLVTASVGDLSGYGWLPITDVQNLWFADPTAPFRLRIVVRPTSATP
jgi:hypothetical protein